MYKTSTLTPFERAAKELSSRIKFQLRLKRGFLSSIFLAVMFLIPTIYIIYPILGEFVRVPIVIFTAIFAALFLGRATGFSTSLDLYEEMVKGGEHGKGNNVG